MKNGNAKELLSRHVLFHSHVIQQFPPLYIELDKIFRQTDAEFIDVLNNLRHNKITSEDVQLLNQFVQPDFDLKKKKVLSFNDA